MAPRFWVGGAGTWDASTTTNWSATSGGAGGASVPGVSDTVTFNASSGGGTVTVNTTVTVISIAWNLFTGTIDWSVNNNNCTVSGGSGLGIDGGSSSGGATRKWLCGTGTFTFSTTANNETLWDLSTTTNLDPASVFNTCTYSFPGSSSTGNASFIGGGKSYGTMTFTASTGGGVRTIQSANTIATLTVGAGNVLNFTAAQTITNAMTLTGTAANPITIRGNVNSVVSLTIAAGSTGTWMAIEGITFVSNAFVATNSFNIGRNTLATITPPSTGGGGGGVIGV